MSDSDPITMTRGELVAMVDASVREAMDRTARLRSLLVEARDALRFTVEHASDEYARDLDAYQQELNAATVALARIESEVGDE